MKPSRINTKSTLQSILLLSLEAFLLVVFLFGVNDLTHNDNPIKLNESAIVPLLSNSTSFYLMAWLMGICCLLTWIKGKKSSWFDQIALWHMPFIVLELCLLWMLAGVLFAPITGG